MPLYEYKCKSCEKIIEKITSDYNQSTIKCDCENKSDCDRIISKQARSVFNGNGFYETDYKVK